MPGMQPQETRTYWFNPSSLEDEDEFMLVGLVLGLAIYNAVLLDFPLPLALYRKLIGQSCTLRDLQDMEPTLGKSLTALLQHEGQSRHADAAHLPQSLCCHAMLLFSWSHCCTFTLHVISKTHTESLVGMISYLQQQLWKRLENFCQLKQQHGF